MTDETRGHPEDTPAPPASTRWSEDPLQDEDAPAPPFVPGRQASTPAPAAHAEAATGPREEPGGEEVAVEEATVREIPTEAAEDEPFPFEVLDEARQEIPPATGPADDEFPFEQFDIEGEEAGAAPEQPATAEAERETMGWTPADLDLEEEDREEEVAAAPPPETHEEERWAEPWAAEEEAAEPEEPQEPELEQLPEPEAAPAVAEGGAAPVAAQEVAALLERLAGTLREEGPAAIRREMDSPDRLTAVIAGYLTGYISGRS